MSDRAEIEISATTSRLAAGLRNARSMLSGFASTAAKGVGGAFSAINSKMKLGEVGKNAAGHVVGSIAARGLDMIVDQANDVRDFERSLQRYAITTNSSAAATAAMRREVNEVSRDSGIARDQVLAGAASYVALTGDAAGAGDAMKAFARIAQASGTSVDDVATATAALRSSMGLDAKDIEAVFSGMIVQGKEGAIELKDLAAQLAELAPRFSQFKGGKSLVGMREIGAAFQVIRHNAGTAGGAATEFEALMGELANNDVLRKLKQIGVNVYDSKGKMKSASEVFEALAKNQKLVDPRVIGEIFGRKEAQLAVLALRDHIDEYGRLRDAASDAGAVQRDYNAYLESDAGRLDKAMNNLKVTVAEAFTPERIQKFTTAVEGLVDKLGPVVELIGKAGDALAGIYGVGQSVRSSLFGKDNGNSFRGTFLEQTMDKKILANADELSKTKEGQSAVYWARYRQKAASGYDEAVGNIMGAEKNDRTTKESIAVAATEYKFGETGQTEAGRRYLRAAGYAEGAAGVSEEKIAEIVRGTIKGMLGPVGQQFGQDVAKSLSGLLGNLKIDLPSDKVVNATRNSQKHWTRPK